MAKSKASVLPVAQELVDHVKSVLQPGGLRWKGGRTSGIVEDRRGTPYGPDSPEAYADAEEDEVDPRVMNVIARNPKLRSALPDYWTPPKRRRD